MAGLLAKGKGPSHYMTQQILLKLQEYKNPDLVQLFIQRNEHDLSMDEVSELFADLKKLLFLNYLVTGADAPAKGFYLTSELELIDQIWHQFILMTQDYHDFCESIFGRYLHHQPEIHNQTSSIEKFDLDAQIKLIETTFGFPTVARWYVELPARHQKSRDLRARLRKVFYEI
jgi:hypothetical protein